jgi:predicted phage terminase large subunit-like protein
MLVITPSNAAEELLKRRKARRFFKDFIAYVKPEYTFEWFHIILAQRIQAWIDGNVKNLIINMPPRYGKSEQASRLAPAFIFGINPDAKIIATSYSSDLAQMMNRDVQRIIDSPAYHRLFPETALNNSNVRSDAQGTWLRNSDVFEIVEKRGQYRSAGRGGAVTGMGGDFIFIDDPIKDKEEAKSQTIKDSVYEWLTTTLFTRQADDQARKLMIVTRWAYDDPVGRVLELCNPNSDRYSPDAERWETLTFPAVAYDHDDPDRSPLDPRKPGDPLWPSKFSLSFLKAQKAANAEDFEALQQQRPVGKGATKFQRVWFKKVSTAPVKAVRVRYWDKAGTEGAGAYTVGTLLAFDGEGYYFEDVIRLQVGYAEREKLIKRTAELDWARYGWVDLGEGIAPVTVWIEQEPGSGGKESAERTILQLAPYPVYAERVTGDKVTRANGLSAQAESGNCYYVEAEWNEPWLRELESFPKGQFKDQADSASGAFNKLSLGWDQSFMVVEDVYEPISPV